MKNTEIFTLQIICNNILKQNPDIINKIYIISTYHHIDSITIKYYNNYRILSYYLYTLNRLYPDIG